jgi:hypothetical protein
MYQEPCKVIQNMGHERKVRYAPEDRDLLVSTPRTVTHQTSHVAPGQWAYRPFEQSSILSSLGEIVVCLDTCHSVESAGNQSSGKPKDGHRMTTYAVATRPPTNNAPSVLSNFKSAKLSAILSLRFCLRVPMRQVSREVRSGNWGTVNKRSAPPKFK